MKISEFHPENQGLQNILQSGRATPAEQNPSLREAKPLLPEDDQVDLSVRSKEMKQVRDILETAPEVRAERVKALKELVDSGEYRVPSDLLADKILKESLLELNR